MYLTRFQILIFTSTIHLYKLVGFPLSKAIEIFEAKHFRIVLAIQLKFQVILKWDTKCNYKKYWSHDIQNFKSWKLIY
jgi:hypothetical protein